MPETPIPHGSLSWFEQPLVATDLWIEHVIDNPFNPQSLDIASIGFTHGRMMIYENPTQRD